MSAARPTRRLAITLIACATGWARTASALGQRDSQVLLTITGRVAERHARGGGTLSRGDLQALPPHHMVTHTPWRAGPQRFGGPLVSDVLRTVGATGDTLHAVALNDYAIDIPVADTERWPVMLAMTLDDKPLSVRDRGPLFIVYPYDSDAVLRDDRYYSRSIWQLHRIEVR